MEIGHPVTQKLVKIIELIDKGKIRLPNFQRDFRWEINDITELIVSLLYGYPAGVLLFWDVRKVEEGNRLDSRPFEGVDETRKLDNEEFLVLDGQQRLTSLYQLFYKDFVITKGNRKIKFFLNLQKIKEGKVDECVESYNISDLQRRKLDQMEEQVKKHLLSLNILLDENKLRGWKNKYITYHWFSEKSLQSESIDEFTKKQSEFDANFLDRGKPIHNLINYEFHIIELPSTDLDVVATIFEKLNTTGQPLNIFEILTAKFYRRVSLYDVDNLREIWQKTKEKYPSIKLFTKDEKDNLLAILIFKIILLKKSIEEDKKALECKRKNMLKDLSSEDIEKYWDECAKSLEKSLNLLKAEYGCPSPDYLPYSTILVPFSLAVDFIENKVKLEQRKDADRKLERWYWASVFSERYDSATDTKSKTDINEIIAWIEDDAKVPTAIKELDTKSINLERITRGAIFTGILNIIIKKQARDFVTREKIDTLIKSNPESVDVHHLFPARMFTTEKEKELADCILNKTLLKSKTNRDYIKYDPPSVYVDRIKRSHEKIIEDLNEHLIPLDEFMANNFDSFLKKREELITMEIEKLVEPIQESQ
jgi:hypothetical protein